MLKRLVCQAARAVGGARAASVPTTSSSAAAVSTTIINVGAQHKGESLAWGEQQRRSMMVMSTRGGGRFSAGVMCGCATLPSHTLALPPSHPSLTNPAGGGSKKEPEKPLSVVLQEFEASLDANVSTRQCVWWLSFSV